MFLKSANEWGNRYFGTVVPYILGWGETLGIPFPAGLRAVPAAYPMKPGPTRKAQGGAAAWPPGTWPVPPPKCQGFAEARPAGSSRSTGTPAFGDAGAGPKASSLPRPSPAYSTPPRLAGRRSLAPRSPTFHPATRRGHVRRARGANERLARNGRDCLTPVTTQSWLGVRCSSAPPSPPRAGPARLLSAHSPLRSQSGGGKCSGPDVRAGQCGGPAGQGVGQLGAWGRTPGS